jgi:hypothetical protein
MASSRFIVSAANPQVDSVDEGYDVECKQEWQQPDLQLSNGSGFAYRLGFACFTDHCRPNPDGQVLRSCIVEGKSASNRESMREAVYRLADSSH